MEIDLDNLPRYPDEQLAGLWAVAQLDPTPTGDWAAGETVRLLGAEIIRRFLVKAGLPIAAHKPESYHWGQLTRFAQYVPPADAAPGDVERWHAGEWVPRDLPAGDVAEGEVAPARVRVAQQAVVDRAITLIDAATSSPEDVGWRMDALREAVEAITFPHGKPPAPAPVVTVPRGVSLDAEAIHNLRVTGLGSQS